jgi:hypothetical protein
VGEKANVVQISLAITHFQPQCGNKPGIFPNKRQKTKTCKKANEIDQAQCHRNALEPSVKLSNEK